MLLEVFALTDIIIVVRVGFIGAWLNELPSISLPSRCSGFPRTAAEDQEGAAQPVFRAELQL